MRVLRRARGIENYDDRAFVSSSALGHVGHDLSPDLKLVGDEEPRTVMPVLAGARGCEMPLTTPVGEKMHGSATVE